MAKSGGAHMQDYVYSFISLVFWDTFENKAILRTRSSTKEGPSALTGSRVPWLPRTRWIVVVVLYDGTA